MTEALSGSSLQGRTIMVVDDDHFVREAMGLIIPEVTGAEVVLCPSGEAALNLLSQRDYDAIILDLRMPRMSGPELFAALQPTHRDRVVFLTGDAVSADAREFLRHSGRPWLLKPVDMDELAGALGTICAAQA